MGENKTNAMPGEIFMLKLLQNMLLLLAISFSHLFVKRFTVKLSSGTKNC